MSTAKSRIVVVASALSVSSGQALGDLLIDQEHVPSNGLGGLEITANQAVGQTFAVGLDGVLAQIDITQIRHHRCSPPDGDLEIRLRQPDGAGGWNVLFTDAVPPAEVPVSSFGEVTFDVQPADIRVAPGDVLNILVSSPDTVPGGCTYAWNGDSPGTYQGGDASIGDRDMAFRTWVQTSPTFSCDGFRPPLDQVVTVHRHRALPLKAQLLDGDGFLLTDLDLLSPPVVQVSYSSSIEPDPVDVTSDALSTGDQTLGNAFFFDDDAQEWHFNLSTKNYTSIGTYTISMASGDNAEYGIDPACRAQFVVQ